MHGEEIVPGESDPATVRKTSDGQRPTPPPRGADYVGFLLCLHTYVPN